MIAEANQQYVGVICIHCHQPIPLSPSAELKQIRFKKHGGSGMGDFSVFSITLRCRVCEREGVYTRSDVIDLDGTPRKGSSRANKNPQKHSRSMRLTLLAENRFPTIWMPSSEQRDLRRLLRHRHQWVRLRSRVQHTLQSMALNHGLT
jgi:hypothetical protein